MAETLLTYYDRALERLQLSPRGREFLSWMRRRPRPTEHETEFFLSEYTWIVSASGFRVSHVQSKWDGLRIAMHGFELERLKEMSSEQIEATYMEHMLRNRAKARAISETIRRYSARTWDFDELMRRLEATQDVDILKTLPYIGDALKYHLARNLGLDVAKPDVHMLRLAPRFGYTGDNTGIQAMCEHIARYRKERVGVVDYVLWFLTKGEATGDWGT